MRGEIYIDSRAGIRSSMADGELLKRCSDGGRRRGWGRDPRSCEAGMRRDPRDNAGGLVNSGPPRHVVAREWTARARVDWTGQNFRRHTVFKHLPNITWAV